MVREKVGLKNLKTILLYFFRETFYFVDIIICYTIDVRIII